MDRTDSTIRSDRREAALPVIVERRTEERRSEPRWITWTRENERGGKDLTNRSAA